MKQISFLLPSVTCMLIKPSHVWIVVEVITLRDNYVSIYFFYYYYFRSKSHYLQKLSSTVIVFASALECKLLEYKIVSWTQTFTVFLESFMLVLYRPSGIFFGMNWRFLVSGFLHHVKGCQWCLNHLSFHILNECAHSTRQETVFPIFVLERVLKMY